jgi:hypothetical protein
MFIPDPGYNNSTKMRRGRKKNVYPTIFCSHKYHKIVNSFIFEQVKTNCFSQNTIKLLFFFPKNCHQVKNIGLGSRVKKTPDPGSGSASLQKMPGQENRDLAPTIFLPLEIMFDSCWSCSQDWARLLRFWLMAGVFSWRFCMRRFPFVHTSVICGWCRSISA